MQVTVRLKESSQPIVFDNVENAYTKGSLYCIYRKIGGVGTVKKIPIANIFDIDETYK